MKRAGGVRHAGARILATWVINSTALIILSHVMKNFELGSVHDALAIAGLLGIANALVWPILQRILLPVTVLTLGFGSLIINGFFVLWLSRFVGQNGAVYIKDWQTGVVVALGITLINSLFTRFLSIDDDDFYYRNVVRRQARRQKFRSKDRTNRTGIVFLEIDGLAHEVLLRAIHSGNAPNMARWLRDGSHRLIRWECDWSSQTGAMQAGILHGSNWDMPSFRWYEKDSGRAMVSNRQKDAIEIEKRHSNGKGLLHYDGASRANLLSGDAPHSMITMSTVSKRRKNQKIGQDYMAFFTNPYSMLRTVTMVFGEIFTEIIQQIRQKRRDVQPRVQRGWFPYPLLRAFTNVIQRELAMAATIQDVYAGRPVIYSMFLGYDEVAHHSGTERTETLTELEKIDRAFGRLELALSDTPRPYKIVVLADHGQTQGPTFKQRYDQSLDELVQELTKSQTNKAGQGEEGWAYASAVASEIRRKPVDIGEKRDETGKKDQSKAKAEISVMPSGALGSISFIKQPKRVTLEWLDHTYPKLIKGLMAHPGIGFLLIKSAKGDLVIAKRGAINLKTGKVTGKNPLADFGPNAVAHVKRTASFPHCPDIVINSTYWLQTGEVAAFEELVGSHGAMGGPQQYPFILYPSDFKPPQKPIVGAETVHKQFRKWLIALNWNSYKY
jgi:uncharacterized membrane protein YvlD (DUF360 family)